MATNASILGDNDLNLDLIKQLQGNEQSKEKALKLLRSILNRRNRELSILMLNLKNNKYSLPELEKMINMSFSMVKTTAKLSDAMQKIDETDPSIPLFERLIKKLVDEYNIIRNKVMELIANKNKLNKNIKDVIDQMNDWKRPQTKAASKATPSMAKNQTKPATIKTIKLDAKDGDLIQKTGLKMLPTEALKVLRESTIASSNANKQGFTTSFNRSGVIVVNNTNGASPVGANNNRVMNQITNQNKESGKFWNKFEEKIDVHFDDMKKLLKEMVEKKEGSGGKSLLGGAADWLFDLLQSKIKNSKVLKMFSKSFYKQAYTDLKTISRDVLSNTAKKAGNSVGIGEEQIGKIKAFKGFITKQLESLKSVVKTQWNNAARLVDDGINGIVDVFSKSGNYVGKTIIGFGETLGGKLSSVSSTITKWSAETISGLERFGSDLGGTFSNIAGSLGKGITSITNLASKGVNAVKMAAGSLGNDLAGSFKSVGSLAGGAFNSVKGIAGKGLSFLGGAAKFLPFAGDVISGYDSYKESGSIGRGVAAGLGSAGGRVVGGLGGSLAGPVGTFAGEVGGGIAGAKGGNALYDSVMGTGVKPVSPTNAVPAAQDNNSLKNPGPQSNVESLNPQAAALLSGDAGRVVSVKLTDQTIGDLAMVLYTLFKGRKPGSGKSGFIQTSFTEGGDNSVSGSTGFGASGIGGGSNNSVLGGGFGGGGANRDNGTGGNLGGNGGTAGGRRIGGAQPDSDSLPENQAKLKDQKSIMEYGQAQASLHGEDPNSPMMKGIQGSIDGIKGKLGDTKMQGGGPGKGSLAQNQQEAYNAARSLGYDDKMARTIVANASGEGLATPGALNKDYHADGSFAHMARGIVQWDPERSEAIKKQFGKYPNEMSVGDQIRAQDWEIKHNPRYAATKRALESGDSDAAQSALVGNYEGSANHRADIAKRTGIRAGLEGKDLDGSYQKSKTGATVAQDDNKIGAPMNGTDPSINNPLGSTAAQANAAMSPNGPATHVKEAQGGANTRTLPISPTLKQQLEYAGDKTGLQAEIFSGGQPAAGTGGKHTGSTRHDNGGAADLKLYETDKDGKRRMLDMRNPDDAAKMKAFTVHAMEAGATGVGAAVDYMGPSGIHIGGGNTNDPTPGGKPLAWGAGGRAGAEDPFMRDAFKEGVDAQKSGAGPKAFAEWQAKKAEEAKAAAAKGQAAPEASHLTAIDPQSKAASIFAPGNTPSGLTPGMGLGAMARKMSEGSSDSKSNPVYSPGADSAKADAQLSKPKIDSEAVAKKLGISGDGTKSEADFADQTKSAGVDRTAYSDTPLNYKHQADMYGSKSLLNNVSYRTDMSGNPINTSGPSFDPLKGRQDFSHTMVKQGMTANESAALVANANRDSGISAKSSQQILGQVSAETGFNPRSEDTNWSASQLHRLWPRKFPTINSARALVAKGPEAEANFVYGNRKDLGNNKPGDGYNFRGRGPNQLTGRAAYDRIGKAIGVDLIAHPDAVNDPVVGAAVTAQFYKEKQAKGADLSNPYGATKATAPAQWKSQVDARGKAANAFAGKTDDLVDQGDMIAHPGQRTEDASLATGKMGSDTAGNMRVLRTDITPKQKNDLDNSSDSNKNNDNSRPGVGTATGGQTTTPKAPDPKPLQSASNTGSNMVPMQHGALGLVVVNSPGLA